MSVSLYSIYKSESFREYCTRYYVTVVTFEKVTSRNIRHTYLSPLPFTSFLPQRDFSIKNETTNEKRASSNSEDKVESNIVRVEYSARHETIYTHMYTYAVGLLCIRNKQQAFSVFLISDVSSWRNGSTFPRDRPPCCFLPTWTIATSRGGNSRNTTRYLRFQLQHSDGQTSNFFFFLFSLFKVASIICSY